MGVNQDVAGACGGARPMRIAPNASSWVIVGFVDEPKNCSLVRVHHNGMVEPASLGAYIGDVG